MPARARDVSPLRARRRAAAAVLGFGLAPVLLQLPVSADLVLAIAWALAWWPTPPQRWWLATGVLVALLLSVRSAEARTVEAALFVGLLFLKLGEALSRSELLLVPALLPLPLLLVTPSTPAALWGAIAVFAAYALIMDPAPGALRALSLPALALVLAGGAVTALPRRAVEGGLEGAPIAPPFTVVLGHEARWPRGRAVAFEARFRGRPPPPSERYWRLLVLSGTDGQRWWAGPAPPPAPHPATPVAPGYQYTVARAATAWPARVTLDLPLWVAGGSLNGEGIVSGRGRQYRARSGPRASLAPPTALDLGVPRLDPRLRALALRLGPPGAGARARAAAVFDYLRRHHFRYTRHPPPGGRDPTARFLLVSHAGYCQDYAAAFVLLMRLQGIPSRMVVGYYGGHSHSDRQALVVRARDAHAWAEIWSVHAGWVRMDATTVARPGPYRAWRRWRGQALRGVVGLLRPLGSAAGNVGAGLLVVAGVVWGLAWARQQLVPWALARHGWRRAPGEGTLAFARRVGRDEPRLEGPLTRFARLDTQRRYSRGGEASGLWVAAAAVLSILLGLKP